MIADADRARAALFAIPPGLPRDEWHEIGRAAIAAGLTVDDVNTWSEPADNYKGRPDVESAFRTIKPNGKTTAGTLFHHARLHGWIDAERPRNRATRAAVAPKPEGKAQHNPAATWDACEPATAAHGYIDRKLGLPDGVRVYSGTLTIAGQACDGALVLPARTLAGELCTLQFIPTEGKKLFLPGAKLAPDACLIVGGTLDKAERVFVCEGIGQAWSAHQATRAPAVVTFGAGRMAGVSRALRDKYPSALLVLVADRGKELQCAAIAADVRGQWVELPADKPKNYDLNDLHRDLRDLRAVAALLEHPKAPPLPAPGTGTCREIELLSPAELFARPVPLDRIRGVLPAKGNAVIFGETGSGKTFGVLHMTLAVVRGVPFFGHKVKQGACIYVAAEGTMRGRLEAYATHHGVPLDGLPLRIVEQPIRLRGPASDTSRLIERVKAAAAELGHVALVVIDTFNRTFAGGNENASEDVGEYLDNLGTIGDALDCLCLVVHHSGKNVSAGARGHSSLKGNLDAELEVTKDEATGIRTLTVTKMRDGRDGDTFSFRLEAVDLGPHPDPEAEDGERWGSCVVLPVDYAPARPAKKRKLTADEEIALRTLRELADESGERLPETSVVPAGVTQAVKVESWRTRFYDRLGGERDTERDAKRQAFGRGRKGLVAKGYAGMHGEFAWTVTQRDTA